jgi:hypothetical protein
MVAAIWWNMSIVELSEMLLPQDLGVQSPYFDSENLDFYKHDKHKQGSLWFLCFILNFELKTFNKVDPYMIWFGKSLPKYRIILKAEIPTDM